MSDNTEKVEGIEVKAVEKATPASSPASVKSTTKVKETTTTTTSTSGTAKRTQMSSVWKDYAENVGSLRILGQRTLADMFNVAPAAKKAKLTDTNAEKASSGSNSAKKASELASLNSIPFSLSAYQESMSDEEKKLLALECETMGKSW
jgi:uracil-DNA glycosylase